MFILSTIYNCILASCSVGSGFGALLCPGAYDAVKTTLI